MNNKANFNAIELILFALVIGFASFLLAATIFVGFGADPSILPIWVQTVFVVVGTIVALAKYNSDRKEKQKVALTAELIASSRMSGAIQRVLTRLRRINTWMEVRDETLNSDDPEEEKGDKLARIDGHLTNLQDQILGKVRGDVMAPALQEIGDHIGFINPVRAVRILKSKRAIEDFRACVFAVDEHVSPTITFYDLDVYQSMGQVKYQSIVAIGQIKAIENNAPDWLLNE